MDIRKVVVIFVIAILFTVFVFSSIEAFYPQPESSDFCDTPVKFRSLETRNCTSLDIPQEFVSNCTENGGRIEYEYDQNCPVDYYCETCWNEYDEARKSHNTYSFLISAVLGLLAIVLALYLPLTKEINKWIGLGFMLGGLFTLFFGTIVYFNDMNRMLRPIVVLGELIIVIYLSYIKLGEPGKKRRK